MPGYVTYGLAQQIELKKARFLCALHIKHDGRSPLPDKGDIRGIFRYNGPKIMEMRAYIATSQHRLIANLRNGIAINNDEKDIEKFANAIGQLAQILNIDIDVNDRLRFLYHPAGERTQITLNGITMGTVKNGAFFHLLLNVWLGNAPPSSLFKKQIQGIEVRGQAALKDDWHGLIPSPQRIASIKSHRTLITARQKASKIPEQASVPETLKPAVAHNASDQESKREILPSPPITKSPNSLTTLAHAPTPVEATAPGPTAGQVFQQHESRANEIVQSEHEFVSESEPESYEEEYGIQELIAINRYYIRVCKMIQMEKFYPLKAKQRNLMGEVEILLELDRSGNYTTEYKVKSKHGILNRTAMKIIDNVSSFPAFPTSIKANTLSFSVPFNFDIEAQR